MNGHCSSETKMSSTNSEKEASIFADVSDTFEYDNMESVEEGKDEDKLGSVEMEKQYREFDKYFKQVRVFEKQLAKFFKTRKKLKSVVKQMSLNVLKDEIEVEERNTPNAIAQEVELIEDKLDDNTPRDIIANSIHSKLMLLDELNSHYKVFKREETEYYTQKDKVLKLMKMSKGKNDAQREAEQNNLELQRQKLYQMEVNATKLCHELTGALFALNCEANMLDPNKATVEDFAGDEKEVRGNGFNLIKEEFEALIAEQLEYSLNMQRLLCGGSLLEKNLGFDLNGKLSELRKVTRESLFKHRTSLFTEAKGLNDGKEVG
eukprot:augustus_masked-scaffold_19-processed-gene-0.26-mRNA-1 protein AED:1.00 eAED:1.00 QI:0/0/0/0/1/1/2/0/319